MPHRSYVVSLSLVFLASLAGCASDGIEVSTTYDPLASFPAQATYSWDVRGNKLPADPRIVELDLDPLIKKAAEEEFAARGYRAGASGASRYRLSYEFVVHSWIGVDESRLVGSLSLLLVEADTGRRVWLGYGTAEVDLGLTRAERRERLRGALAEMLEKFPPAQRR